MERGDPGSIPGRTRTSPNMRRDVVPLGKQSGFRPGHSTATTLLDAKDHVLHNMDKGNLVGVVFLDLKKAFDTCGGAVGPLNYNNYRYYRTEQLEWCFNADYVTAALRASTRH
ncbi:hypothetical protein Bbelb_221360 [Branchiostoma belcheri]|nr:hypothetical protein Bbelb_221360 [Branchiostoma belcheri]